MKVVVIPLGGEEAPKVRPGSEMFTNSIGMEFSPIPSGSFVMGSPDGTGDTTHRPVNIAEPGRIPHEGQHNVVISKPFYMQTTEMTQGQYLEIVGTNPSHYSTCGLDCPVEKVSWNDAKAFVSAINSRENRINCNLPVNTCYSLPTEAQWEYAARAGTTTAFYNGEITHTGCVTKDPNLDAIGWFCKNSIGSVQPVAQKQANNWGLYDTSGNVSEWVEDTYGGYGSAAAVTDPVSTSGSYHVYRGGNWSNDAAYSRSAARDNDYLFPQSSQWGFRLALSSGQ